jgi:hypothetical protein
MIHLRHAIHEVNNVQIVLAVSIIQQKTPLLTLSIYHILVQSLGAREKQGEEKKKETRQPYPRVSRSQAYD